MEIFKCFYLIRKLNILYTENSEKALVDEEIYVSERINALNVPVLTIDPSITTEDENVEIDQFSNVSLNFIY